MPTQRPAGIDLIRQSIVRGTISRFAAYVEQRCPNRAMSDRAARLTLDIIDISHLSHISTRNSPIEYSRV
jgi:hypothetical protein